MSDDALALSPYLRRLGLDAPPPPTLAALCDLQLRHLLAIPFETLTTLLHASVPIDVGSLQHKIIDGHRGGYCYELNLLFLALLCRLGFDARPLSGRVVMGGPEDTQTPRTHLLLLVTVDGARYVVDVGFGGMVPTAPLRLDSEDVQLTPHEPYRISRHGDGYVLRAQVASEWRALYVFDLAEAPSIDHEVGNWYVATHPDSPFLGHLVAARIRRGGRETLRNGEHAIHRLGAASARRRLASPDDVLAALRTRFDIRVPGDRRLYEAIERLLAT